MPPSDPLSGLYLGETLLGRYRIDSFLASGGFCLVFRARDLVDAKDVAIKVLKPGAIGEPVLEFQTEGSLLDLLRRRSRVVGLLGPPANVDTIIISKAGVGVPIPLPVSFMVIELADICLSDIVANRADVSWRSRLSLFRDVVLGAHQMHLDMIVHRDIKSDNILVSLSGANARASIADLGRGRNLREPPRFVPDQYIAGRGDLRFAPPELLCLTGVDDNPVAFRRADIYLLGSTFFELCTGQGITSIAYGNPRAILVSALAIDPARRSSDYLARIPEHRARYQPGFFLAEHELPTHLRDEGGRLLRQLCDPDPVERERRSRLEVHEPAWGLNWLLRRVDILRRLDSLEGAYTRRRKRRAA
jgi:serine/threonine protein kinase